MKDIFLHSFLVLLFVASTHAQNLIPNSRFDDYSTYLDANNNLVYQPNWWYYDLQNLNHPIYYSSDRFLNKDVIYNFHPDADLVLQGQKLNYISILLLQNTQKAYTILKEPLKKGHRYHLQLDIKAFRQSNCLSDILVGFKDTIDFKNEVSNYRVQLTFQDSAKESLFHRWYTTSLDFTALGNEKVLVLGDGSSDDYIQIINSNHRKFFYNYDGGPYTIKYFIDNLNLTEMASKNESLRIDQIDSLKIGDSFVLQNIYFDFDRYILLEKSFPMLDRLAEYLKTKSKVRIQVSGHTDNVGIKEYNDDLSMKRAKSVVDYLIYKGINTERLQSIGYGSSVPTHSNDTEYGRQQNRRIEIKIVDK